LKYTPKDKSVSVSLTSTNSKIDFSVSDEGHGISEGEKKKIFEKFYRVGDESTRSTKGTGLGLYLVKRIAYDHKGEVTVTSNIGNGSIFTVSFKR
jgi:signal transduction histidine kinase